jgi:hypothetical protein
MPEKTVKRRSRCHPLTVLDDHSRFSVVLKACADERGETVREVLTSAFRRYGLPAAMLMDNGAPWGSDHDRPFTAFSLWLIQLGIRVAHGRAYHPQTQSKDERFHRTLKFEVLRHFNFTTLAHCQREFDHFRQRYNLLRPHDALGLATPASRYRPSPIPFPTACRRSSTLAVSRCAKCKTMAGLPIRAWSSSRPIHPEGLIEPMPAIVRDGGGGRMAGAVNTIGQSKRGGGDRSSRARENEQRSFVEW